MKDLMSILLLNLDGTVFRSFETVQSCSRFFGTKQIPGKALNTDSILRRKYRMVTKDFYLHHRDTVLSWSSKTKGEITKDLEAQKNDMLKKKRTVVYIDNIGNATEYKNYCTLAKKLGLSKERVRQILNYGCKKHNIQFKHPELRGLIAKNIVV